MATPVKPAPTFLALIFAIACATSVAATTNAPTATAQSIDARIRELGAARHAVREQAADVLRRIGLPAAEALRRAARSNDPEVHTRAREILKDVLLGITPDWPAELADTARGLIGEESADARCATIRTVAERMQTRCIAFLVAAMAREFERDARTALKCLKSFDRASVPWTQVATLIGEPQTRQQAEALALAHELNERPVAALTVMQRHGLNNDARRKLIDQAVKDLKTMHKESRFDELIAAASPYAAAATNEARFLYFQAHGLQHTDGSGDADALRRKALELNPDDEAPHFVCGELLNELGRADWAADEWRRILAIAPTNDVYDMNAWARLGAFHAGAGDYALAADFYEALLEAYTTARERSTGYGLLGADKDTLAAKVRGLRKLAAGRADRPRQDVKLHFEIETQVKGGRDRELDEALAGTDDIVNVNIKPEGIRLLDKDCAGLSYDPAGQTLAVLLNGRPCATRGLALKGATGTVAVASDDCCYIVDVDAATGKIVRRSRFELDYVLKLKSGTDSPPRGARFEVRGKTYDWDAFTRGIPLDWLPDKLGIKLQRTTPGGVKEDTCELPLRDKRFQRLHGNR